MLFCAGTLFWIVVTSSIGFIMLYYLSYESGKLVDKVEPHQKVFNGIIRKLTGANISVHQISLIDSSDVINSNFHKAKINLDECDAYLDTLLTGGFIKESSREGDRFYDEFPVVPVTDATRKKEIGDVGANIEKMKGLLTAIVSSGGVGKDRTDLFRKHISEYDTLTQDTVIALNKIVAALSKESDKITHIIKRGFDIALILIILTFLTGSSLSVIFGVLISINLVKPINAIVSNFRAFASKKDFEREIKVTSKDELGTLADEYNKFMDTIDAMSSFKKIIEEDETVDDVYLRLGNLLTKDLGMEFCVIYEISVQKNTIKIGYPSNIPISEIHCSMDILLNCDLCRVKRTGHIISSREREDICKFFTSETADVHICLPIFISGKVGGVVQFVVPKEKAGDPELKEKIGKAQQYIKETQPVLEAKRIMRAFKESSIKDALTGIYNRRFLEETSETLVAGVQRRGSSLGFLMCDLDYFKEVNDKYGHDTGDQVLKETANVIRKSVRHSDLVIRFGGEEFIVLLIDIKPETSVETAKKIRVNMEETNISVTGGFIKKTISIGVSEFPKDTESFWEAIKFADVALYRAKDTGRNKVVRFTTDMWKEDRY